MTKLTLATFALLCIGLQDPPKDTDLVLHLTLDGKVEEAAGKAVGTVEWGEGKKGGALKLDGKAVNCGKRPTVLNPNFDSWGGAFPGFLILNNKKMTGLSSQVKLYIYSHECGHQFIGADETKADLFAIRRGVKYGWLDAQGLEDICTFISQLKGDAVHPPGPQRCEAMRDYYRQLVGSGAGQQAKSPGSSSGAQTLGPAE